WKARAPHRRSASWTTACLSRGPTRAATGGLERFSLGRLPPLLCQEPIIPGPRLSASGRGVLARAPLRTAIFGPRGSPRWDVWRERIISRVSKARSDRTLIHRDGCVKVALSPAHLDTGQWPGRDMGLSARYARGRQVLKWRIAVWSPARP